MACEVCNVKFSFFKRKKQCTDCLRYFCSECVIKRFDKTLSCSNCSLLSTRPLVRSQITQMRCKDLRHYLLAKKVSVKGCIEKEDLIELLMTFANGSNNYSHTENETTTVEHTDGYPSSYTTEVKREWIDRPQPDSIHETDTGIARVEIEQLSDNHSTTDEGPAPLISEGVDSSDISDVHHSSDVFTEIPVRSDLVKLSDINASSELEYLSIRQLKNLLSFNRVDYKGCTERCELLDKACRLWQDYRQSKSASEKLDENLCKICWDEPMECVILECGHVACCINCGKKMSECPICKQYVVRVVRFFKA